MLLVDDVTVPALPQRTLFRYQFGNHLGSVGVELDDAAKVISYEEFHPYGTSAYRLMNSDVEVPAKRYRYTGVERDEESGLRSHGARYIAPSLAVWLSVDPQFPKGDVNCYRYALGNPLKFFDPDGQQAMPATPEQMEMVRRALEVSTESLLHAPIYIPPEDHSMVARMMPDGTFLMAERSHAERDYRETSRQMAVARFRKTFKNVTGGAGGALGSLAGGDSGSDKDASGMEC